MAVEHASRFISGCHGDGYRALLFLGQPIPEENEDSLDDSEHNEDDAHGHTRHVHPAGGSHPHEDGHTSQKQETSKDENSCQVRFMHHSNGLG